MNKEELEKEADTYLDKKYLKDMGVRRPCKQAYLAGAEPREKQIAELEAENEQIKNSDTLCKLIGEQKRKISYLKAQIEKMKCCGNCSHFKLDSSGLYPINVCELTYPNRCKDHDKWEIEK